MEFGGYLLCHCLAFFPLEKLLTLVIGEEHGFVHFHCVPLLPCFLRCFSFDKRDSEVIRRHLRIVFGWSEAFSELHLSHPPIYQGIGPYKPWQSEYKSLLAEFGNVELLCLRPLTKGEQH